MNVYTNGQTAARNAQAITIQAWNAVYGSANREITEPYQFYNAACDPTSWLYRACAQSNFGGYYGAHMGMMHPHGYVEDVMNKTQRWVQHRGGVASVMEYEDMFTPQVMSRWYSQAPVRDDLPPCYQQRAFQFTERTDESEIGSETGACPPQTKCDPPPPTEQVDAGSSAGEVC